MLLIAVPLNAEPGSITPGSITYVENRMGMFVTPMPPMWALRPDPPSGPRTAPFEKPRVGLGSDVLNGGFVFLVLVLIVGLIVMAAYP